MTAALIKVSWRHKTMRIADRVIVASFKAARRPENARKGLHRTRDRDGVVLSLRRFYLEVHGTPVNGVVAVGGRRRVYGVGTVRVDHA